VTRAVDIVSEVAAALQHAHDMGVIHRDVKSGNVMVDRAGHIQVIDFGLSRARDDERLTSSQVTLGTVACMAPEVADRRPATSLSDVYGLGVIAYEALTGQLPFHAAQEAALLLSILKDDPPAPSTIRPEVSPGIERAVLRAMARDPAERPPSPAAFALELKAALDAQAPATAKDRTRQEPRAAPARAPTRVSRVFLAVLPFQDLDASEASSRQALFAGGLSDALASALARSDQLHVLAEARTADLAGQSQTETARRLGANRLLLGSVRRSGAQIRVTYSIVDPFAGIRTAGGSVDGLISNLFALEDELVADVTRALEIEPEPDRGAAPPRGDPAARERILLARGYLLRYDSPAALDGAIQVLEEVLQRDGETAERLALLGRAFLMKYRLTEHPPLEASATRACERALELDPESPDVLLTLGELRLATGKYDDARTCFERSHEHRPTSEALIGRARALEALGRSGEAESDLRNAIRREPDHWPAHNWLGLLYLHESRYPEAIAAWRQVVALVPDHAAVHANLAAAHFRLGAFEEAIAECQRTLVLQPTARALMTLGASFYLLGRHAEASDAFERAVALQPSDPVTWSGLGSVCRQIPERAERAREALLCAETLLRDRLDRSPGDAVSWARLAACLCNLEQPRESRIAIERATALRSNSVEVMIAAVGVYQAADPETALSWLKRAIDAGYGAASVVRDPALRPLHAFPDFWSIVGLTPPGKEKG
jgi:tetratricopeptide (TPR) repeat protein